MAYFRPRRQRRYNNYLLCGFMPFEAVEFSAIPYVEAPYLRKMMRERLRIKNAFIKQADAMEWSRTRREEEYREVIRFEYINHGWVRVKEVWRVGRTRYQASPWEMLREYRQKAIDRGEYFPRPRKAVRRDFFGNIVNIRISKGDVEGQKARARTRTKASIGTQDYALYQRQRAAQKERARERRKALEH